jgi:hypothetical protein
MKRKHSVSATLMSVPSCIYKYTLYTDIYKRLQQRTLKRLITKVFIGTFTTSRHNIATIDNYIIFDWMIHSRNRHNCIIVIDVILVVLLQVHVVHAIEWKTFDWVEASVFTCLYSLLEEREVYGITCIALGIEVSLAGRH